MLINTGLSVRFSTHVFYTNKFYLVWRLEVWKNNIFLKTMADIHHLVFFMHAECALKFVYACWACATNLPTYAEHALKKLSTHAEHPLTFFSACSACFNSDASSSSDDNNKQHRGWQQWHDRPQQQERKQQLEWKQQENRQQSKDANNIRNPSKSNEAGNSMQGGQQQHRHH